MATWLITGATGFLGRHVLGLLEAGPARDSGEEDRVVAIGRSRPEAIPADRFVAADLAEPGPTSLAVRMVEPDFVIHAAGRTPPASDEEMERSNVVATAHVLGALRSLGKPVRVVLAGSAAELGPVPEAELPVGEDYPCRPDGAYGRSKLTATLAGLSESAPLEVCCARVFNPIGPGMPASQAFGDFAVRLAAPSTDPLELAVGDLESRRDFIDVRDVAAALIALAGRGKPGRAYHVGTGTSRSVREGLECLIRLSGRTVRLHADPSRMWSRGPRDSRADTRRIREHTGWAPAIPFEQSLRELWDALLLA
ncbi:GDP-6-deoxy-D-mannose reductase [Aquisphaera giovannonii]|uniref:GDP-6-deoxy-D-mannose reductase n=1 Tax=Aquisphaera giovannonii TaxID=406548 RepID=A0A5B9W9U2_9BACT|nr:NAD-dependent epimerase/dehydratase family protein [Aquisphaera giovannonii]QEH37323.1 GDP-6-deoxy-D-mannose reductase [Aquisphaera giovannonii]